MKVGVTLLAALLLAGISPALPEQAAGTSRVQDYLLQATARPGDARRGSTGSLHVSWPAFAAADGVHVVPGGSQDVLVQEGGLVRVDLMVFVNYTVVYHLAGSPAYTEIWSVPSSSTPLLINAVRSPALTPCV